MSNVTSFVNELVRAANEVGTLTDSEAARLLDRAVRSILEMREEVGIPPSNSSADAVLIVQAIARSVNGGNRSNEEVRAAFLDAAGMIRDLRIVIAESVQLVLRAPRSADNDQQR